MSAPAATIAIPTYRRFNYLREAVASAQSQTVSDIEIVIGDDGDSQEIRQWSSAEAIRDPRIRYQNNGRQLGLAGNWNAVTRAASGEYVVVIGDDDRLRPAFVERLLFAGRGANAVFSNHYVIDERGARDDLSTHAFANRYGRNGLPPGPVRRPAACVWRNSIPMSACLVRTADVQRLAFKEDLNTPEIELFARMAAEGAVFVFVPEYLSEYRAHPGSQTSAGLAGERLIRYLDPIPVPPEDEAIKRTFMEQTLIAAVSKRLARGDMPGARALMEHRYYPAIRMRPLRVGAQRTLAALPPMGVVWLMKTMVPALRALRKSDGLRLHPTTR